MLSTNHTFAVCAYKESPYLEACIRSLVGQTQKTNIIVCTSTPCRYIEDLAKKYDLPYFVREGKSDIQDDWNFAFDSAETDYVTIAHQDDVYSKYYFEELAKHIPDEEMTLYITDYLPLKSSNPGKRDLNCRIRRLLRTPLKIRKFAASKGMRKLTLAFGNSICCPAVTYNKKRLGSTIFDSEFKFCIDWDTFLKYAEADGHFVYVDRPLVQYRIHDGATSKEFIVDHRRITEDTAMFRKFWPAPVVKVIMAFYKKAYNTYG